MISVKRQLFSKDFAKCFNGLFAMTKATVGQWGEALALRVPTDIAHATGLVDGETVDIEPIPGGFLVTWREVGSTAGRREAQAAAADMVAERRYFTLGDVSIRDLIVEGRRS